MSKDNGGSAFPSSNSQDTVWYSEGMTLRDWFAGRAMQALLSCPDVTDGMKVVKVSYDIADAMLAQRNKP